MANKFMKRDSISFISHQGNTNKNKRNYMPNKIAKTKLTDNTKRRQGWRTNETIGLLGKGVGRRSVI